MVLSDSPACLIRLQGCAEQQSQRVRMSNRVDSACRKKQKQIRHCDIFKLSVVSNVTVVRFFSPNK